MRVFLAGMMFALATPLALADGVKEDTASGAAKPETAPPAGSPEMGVLIIIGIVALLILIAWIIARAGEESRGGDSSLI
jgi:hypothetical protein